MDESIRTKLYRASEELSLHLAVPPTQMEEVFNFNPRKMDTATSFTLSRYTVMLGQFLISLQVKYNTARVKAGQTKRVLERKVQILIQSGGIEGKTLKEREANAVISDPTLQELELEYNEAAAERDFLDGIDKPIIEFINAIKSELRRRAEERQYVEKERPS